MSIDGDTTINHWLAHHGHIDLIAPRPARPDRRPDLDKARGVLLGTIAGACVLIWGYVIARLVFG